MNNWRKPLENLPEEMTKIWSCTNANCNGWMRDSLSFKEVPVCAQCKSAMVSSERKLPILMSSDQQVKRFRSNQKKEQDAAAQQDTASLGEEGDSPLQSVRHR